MNQQSRVSVAAGAADANTSTTQPSNRVVILRTLTLATLTLLAGLALSLGLTTAANAATNTATTTAANTAYTNAYNKAYKTAAKKCKTGTKGKTCRAKAVTTAKTAGTKAKNAVIAKANADAAAAQPTTPPATDDLGTGVTIDWDYINQQNQAAAQKAAEDAAANAGSDPNWNPMNSCTNCG